MKEIHLDNNACSIAQHLAETRSDSFAHDSYESTAFGKSSYEVHLLGAKTEVAVSLHYNLLVDMKERLEGDEYDFEVSYNGQPATLDVKATTYRPPWMQVRESKTNSDYYLATHIDNPDSTTARLIGFASREQVLDADRIRSPGGGDHLNYRLWEDEMDEIPSKMAISKQRKPARSVASD